MRTILGIETSCDETGIALITGKDGSTEVSILSEAIHSQVKTHQEYGGVVPELAAREHLVNLPLLTDSVLQEAGLSLTDVDLIGVTAGPGLKGCLLNGLLFASGIATSLNIPVYPVNHIEAHVLSVLLENPTFEFPFLTLIVSGGHTELHLVSDIGRYTLLARTTDDAAGEAFDKSAKLLGLPYPGGPILAQYADRYAEKCLPSPPTTGFTLPKVMRHQAGFSFSGLKTAIALLIKEHGGEETDEALKEELAWAIQQSIIDALLSKVERALAQTQCKKLAVCGGVSANRALRSAVQALPDLACAFPSLTHCMDNGTMIALVAHLRTQRELPSLPFKAIPRAPIETESMEGEV
jgi:N6-L-threonylcarbamoyladenine synthase